MTHIVQLAQTTNGQTHSNNSSATADELFELFDHFLGLALKCFVRSFFFSHTWIREGKSELQICYNYEVETLTSNNSL